MEERTRKREVKSRSILVECSASAPGLLAGVAWRGGAVRCSCAGPMASPPPAGRGEQMLDHVVPLQLVAQLPAPAPHHPCKCTRPLISDAWGGCGSCRLAAASVVPDMCGMRHGCTCKAPNKPSTPARQQMQGTLHKLYALHTRACRAHAAGMAVHAVRAQAHL